MLIKKGPDKIVSTYVLLVVILYRKPQGHPKKIVHIYNHNMILLNDGKWTDW